MPIAKHLRFPDLVDAGIVANRVTLARMIKAGFPSGRLLGPNTRAWTETEIQAWLDARPVERAPEVAPREQRFAARKAKTGKDAAPKRKRRGH